jgi:hypothetical protein
VPIAVAPDAVEYVLAPQSVHAAEPVAVLYFPAAHVLHVPPSGSVEPYTSTSATFMKFALYCSNNKYLPLKTQAKSLDPVNQFWLSAQNCPLDTGSDCATFRAKLLSLDSQQSALLKIRIMEINTICWKSNMR